MRSSLVKRKRNKAAKPKKVVTLNMLNVLDNFGNDNIAKVMN